MAFNVFISYATKDLSVVDQVRTVLEGSSVAVFVAEHSVPAGSPLAQSIITAIKQCDIFIVLWSRNADASDWVPQEVGIAKADNKHIIPVLLDPGLKPPGFMSDLKYLDATCDPQRAFTWLRDNVFAKATEKQKQEGLVWLGIGAALLWLLSRE